MLFCQIHHFQSQIRIFVQSCNWIIWQSPHTLENPQHNSSSKSFKLTSRCTIPCQHISWFFSKTKLNAYAPSFHHLILLVTFFLHLPHLQRLSILFQPLSLKFTNSFLLPKVNNVSLIPSKLSFWNSASMNLVQSSQISSISLFLKEFFHRHSNKLLSSLFSKNHLYLLRWSQQLSSNFKPQLHFQNSLKSCCLPHSIFSPVF